MLLLIGATQGEEDNAKIYLNTSNVTVNQNMKKK